MASARKILVLFFAFLLLFSSASAQSYFSALRVKSGHSISPANAFPGDVITLNATIEGKSESKIAENISAELFLNESYFEAVNVVDELGSIGNNEAKTASFLFKAKDGAPAGSYRVPLKLSYEVAGAKVNESYDLNFSLARCYGLDLSNVSYSTQFPYGGEEVLLTATIENICNGAARNATAELIPITNSTFDPFILLSSSVAQAGSIQPGETKKVTFSLKPSADAEPKIYVFEVDLNCFDCSATKKEKVSFEVLAKPVLIFSGVNYAIEGRDDKQLFPGDAFSLSVQVDNIGKSEAKAVKVVLETDDAVNGSKENFVGNVDEDDTGAAIFDLSIAPSAQRGGHTATINVFYLDELGGEQVISDTYVIFVNERPPESPVFLLFLIIIILVVLYFILKMVFRQLALRKAKLR